MARLYLGIDVGTTSARAAVFDRDGKRHGMGASPFPVWRIGADFVQQSSEAIWRSVCEATRAAMKEAGAKPEDVVGIGFDATCSLVALDASDRPVTVSPQGEPDQNVIVWMDHRAIDQAARINATRHRVLEYVGGTISPEMEPPKLLWLKEHLPESFARAARFFDLPDFLVYRATGADVRSLCTTVCKWTYVGHESTWDASFFDAIGLSSLCSDGFARIGTKVRPIGERAGVVSALASKELGIAPGVAVSVAIIDAHAGGLGLLGAWGEGDLESRLALICGTSTCHMAVSREARFIPGVWGPYFSAMVPDLWLTEGGQSATGALIDHVVRSHARAAELEAQAQREGTNIYALLERRLDLLAQHEPFPAALTRHLHVMPDFHGNRSPRADPTLRGMVSGLNLGDGVDDLALSYLATIQALAHGTRHVVDTLNRAGYRIDTLVACGGDTKSAVFVREHADVTGCRIVLPVEREAVLLGAAMLGAVASGDVDGVTTAMRTMSRPEQVITPAIGEVAKFHDQKHRVFHRMVEDQLAYRALMR